MKRYFVAGLVAVGLAPFLVSAGDALSQQAGRPATQTPQAAPSSRASAIEGVAVLVNDEVISYTDVRRRMDLILLRYGGRPDEEIIRAAQSEATESLIEEKIELQEFKKLAKDAEITDDDINRELSRIASQNKQTQEAFVAALTNRGIAIQTLKDQLKAQIAWNELIRGRFARTIRVSELRISDTLDRVTGSLNKPQYRLAEIFQYAPDAASREKATTNLQALRRQIEQGAPFDQVAQQFSAAPSASAGGDLGWMTVDDMRPEFVSAIVAATPPAFLPPINTEDGVYLLAYLGKREPADPSKAKLKLKQVSLSGADAATKLQKIKSGANNCAAVDSAAAAVDGATVTPLNDIELSAMETTIHDALATLQIGQSTGVLDVGGAKSVLFVCDRTLGGAQMPTRDQVRNQLFDSEITMLADRYLRDLKREATIIRR